MDDAAPRFATAPYRSAIDAGVIDNVMFRETAMASFQIEKIAKAKLSAWIEFAVTKSILAADG